MGVLSRARVTAVRSWRDCVKVWHTRVLRQCAIVECDRQTVPSKAGLL